MEVVLLVFNGCISFIVLLATSDELFDSEIEQLLFSSTVLLIVFDVVSLIAFNLSADAFCVVEELQQIK